MDVSPNQLGPAPDRVDRLVPRGLDDPGASELGYAGGTPLIQRGCEGVLGRLLGYFEVTHHPNQRRDDTAPIGAIECRHRLAGIRVHPQMVNNSWMGVDSGIRRSTQSGRRTA